MRIIAGAYRSRKLHTLEGDHTRPTLDRIKEAMFSSVGGTFHKGKMLDLFAGSGSVGLEALSRGMDHIYFNDASKAAVRVIQSNIDLLQVGQQCTLREGDFRQALEAWKDERFAFIFLDPPYALPVLEECIQYIDTHDMLEDGGILVAESGMEVVLKKRYGTLYQSKEKTYRVTRMTYFKKEF